MELMRRRWNRVAGGSPEPAFVGPFREHGPVEDGTVGRVHGNQQSDVLAEVVGNLDARGDVEEEAQIGGHQIVADFADDHQFDRSVILNIELALYPNLK